MKLSLKLLRIDEKDVYQTVKHPTKTVDGKDVVEVKRIGTKVSTKELLDTLVEG